MAGLMRRVVSSLLAAALCVSGQSPTTLPNVAPSFVVAKQFNNCSNMPGCPSPGHEGPSVYTTLIAQDGPGFRDRMGPISLLPPHENQVLIKRFDLAQQFLLWVDATQSPERVINCSKAPVNVPVNQSEWAVAYVDGLLTRGGVFDRMAQCTSSVLPDCPVWFHDNDFGISCGNQTFTGHERVVFLLIPTAEPATPSTNFSISGLDNVITYPKDCPQLCRGGPPKFWHQDWPDISVTPSPKLFEVPTSGCAEVSATTLRAGFKGGRPNE